jgi:hypothetical protein
MKLIISYLILFLLLFLNPGCKQPGQGSYSELTKDEFINDLKNAYIQLFLGTGG